MPDAADREVRLAFWKMHVLHHADHGPVYGLWLLEELAEHGHRLSPGTLYPILARMERNGWLRSTSAERAKGRKNYRITRSGRRVLGQLRSEVDELHRELVLGIEPRPETMGRYTVRRSKRGKVGGRSRGDRRGS